MTSRGIGFLEAGKYVWGGFGEESLLGLYVWAASFGASYGAVLVARSRIQGCIGQVGATTILMAIVTVPPWLSYGAHEHALALPLVSAVMLPFVYAISDRWAASRTRA